MGPLTRLGIERWRSRRGGALHRGAVTFAWQRLDRAGGSLLGHGCCRLQVGRLPGLRLTWQFGRRVCTAALMLEADAGAEHELTLHAALWRLVDLFLTVQLPVRWAPDRPATHGARALGAWCDGEYLFGYLWSDRTGRGPQRQWAVNLPDLLWGRPVTTRTDLETGAFDLALPEGVYPCRYRLHEDRWQRPRRRTARVLRRVTVTPAVPIPLPGKGETAHDLEDDALVKIVFPADSAAAARAALRRRVLQDRARYGGPDWTPQAADGSGQGAGS